LVTNAVAFAPAEAVTTGAGSIVGEIMRTMAAPKLLVPPFVDGPVLVVQADAARALPNRSGQ
jgi:hypothetical protein